jgi:hypothetical protein
VQAPEGYEHLDPGFWDRVQPDPDSDCLLFQSCAISKHTYAGKEILAYLTAGDMRPKHRKCRRPKCVNPEHLVWSVYTPPRPRSRKPRTQGSFNRWYAQC